MQKISFFLLLLSVISCQPDPAGKEPTKKLETEVMRVHDVAMADMDKIYRLRKKLRQLYDSLQIRNADPAALKNIMQHLVLLEHADESMMNWMRQYKAPKPGQPADSIQSYLETELQKIERVKTKIDSTLSASEKTYKEYEPQP